MSRRTQKGGFSLSWIVVSYFAICGGIVLPILVLVVALRDRALDPRAAAYVACGAGGLLGGFFAGRASRHFSVLEPAIAGALVIGSVYALVKWTALGPWAFAFAQQAIIRESLVLGGLAFGGGLSGALLGELSWSGEPSPHPIRWLGMGVFLTVGALLSTAIATSIVFADHALQDPEVLRRLLSKGTVELNDDVVAMAVLITLGSTGFLGGLVAQTAAPVRIWIVATVAVFLTIAGGLLGLFALGEALDRTVVEGSLIIGGGAAFLGLVGALIAWGARRLVAPAASSSRY